MAAFPFGVLPRLSRLLECSMRAAPLRAPAATVRLSDAVSPGLGRRPREHPGRLLRRRAKKRPPRRARQRPRAAAAAPAARRMGGACTPLKFAAPWAPRARCIKRGGSPVGSRPGGHGGSTAARRCPATRAAPAAACHAAAVARTRGGRM
eukprot:355668-Chlamydomonas_euryale.AAC.3